MPIDSTSEKVLPPINLTVVPPSNFAENTKEAREKYQAQHKDSTSNLSEKRPSAATMNPANLKKPTHIGK